MPPAREAFKWWVRRFRKKGRPSEEPRTIVRFAEHHPGLFSRCREQTWAKKVLGQTKRREPIRRYRHWFASYIAAQPPQICSHLLYLADSPYSPSLASRYDTSGFFEKTFGPHRRLYIDRKSVIGIITPIATVSQDRWVRPRHTWNARYFHEPTSSYAGPALS
jgi:hypothetical protein